MMEFRIDCDSLACRDSRNKFKALFRTVIRHSQCCLVLYINHEKSIIPSHAVDIIVYLLCDFQVC